MEVYPMMWWNHGGWGAGDWLAMGFMMVIFWGLVIALVVWLVRSARSGRGNDAGSGISTQGADELLAQRFARGEIDEQQFAQRRAALHPDVPGPQRRR
jgi:putative membrane protein